jgi:hypothetical protein
VVSTPEYLDPSFLDGYATAAQLAQTVVQKFKADTGASPELWMGETSGAGGATHGAHLVIGRFLGIFWFADKLGVAAATGHSVVCKQQYQYQAFLGSSGEVEVSPEYWLSYLWKKLMGRGVLQVHGGGGLVRVYASVDHHASGGAITAVVINLGPSNASVPVAIRSSKQQQRDVPVSHELYSLSAWPDASDMQANRTALNGRELKLGADGTAPTLDPVIGQGLVVEAPGLSVSFAVFR